jgi:hypothetical protein
MVCKSVRPFNFSILTTSRNPFISRGLEQLNHRYIAAAAAYFKGNGQEDVSLRWDEQQPLGTIVMKIRYQVMFKVH